MPTNSQLQACSWGIVRNQGTIADGYDTHLLIQHIDIDLKYGLQSNGRSSLDDRGGCDNYGLTVQ